MKFSPTLVTVLGLRLSAAVAAIEIDEAIIPGSFIVEFEADQNSNSLFEELKSDGIAVSPGKEIHYRLFTGASFQVENVSLTACPFFLFEWKTYNHGAG